MSLERTYNVFRAAAAYGILPNPMVKFVLRTPRTVDGRNLHHLLYIHSHVSSTQALLRVFSIYAWMHMHVHLYVLCIRHMYVHV